MIATAGSQVLLIIVVMLLHTLYLELFVVSVCCVVNPLMVFYWNEAWLINEWLSHVLFSFKVVLFVCICFILIGTFLNNIVLLGVLLDLCVGLASAILESVFVLCLPVFVLLIVIDIVPVIEEDCILLDFILFLLFNLWSWLRLDNMIKRLVQEFKFLLCLGCFDEWL